MFATLLSAIRLATRVPSSGSDQQSTSKSPSNPTDGEFPDTHINSRRGTMCLYSTQVHQGLVPTSKDPIRPRLANQHTTAVADAAGLIRAPPQLRPPTTSSCSGTVVPSLGLRRPGAMHMPRTHGLDSFLHLHTGDKTHSRWTPRRLFSRKSFLVLDDVEEDGHDHYNDHDAATLLGEYSPTDELIAEKQLVTPSPEDIMQQISRKIVQNQDDLLEEEEEKSQDLTNYDWAFSHLTYDSDNEMDPDSPTYYSASDSDASGPQTPLEISYPSSCCIPAHVLLQRLVEAHSESEPVAAAAPTHVLAAAHTVNEQKLVAVDDEGREIWVTALAPAPRCPQRRAKIIGTREDGAGLCRVHKCDLPCVPCDPSVPRYIEF